jgi:hypothetical protein
LRRRRRRGVSLSKKSLAAIEARLEAQVEALASAVIASLRPHLAAPPARVMAKGRARVTPVELARRAGAQAGPIDEAMRARIERQMRTAGLR